MDKENNYDNLSKENFESNVIFNIINVNEQNTIDLYSSLLSKKSFKTFLDNKDLVSTVLSFFEHNLNIAETSKHSFMHRNTLVYRLEKVHKLTGFNVRLFCDAVSLFAVLVLCYKNGHLF